MTARAALFSLLDGDGTLRGLGVETVYPTNAVDTPAEQCFIVIRWDTRDQQFGGTGTQGCTVWAHDRDRDYARIDQVLARVEDLLASTIHRAGEDGWTLTQADYRGQSPDLFDSGYDTCTRWSEFQIAARRT